jgi:hypothetical protein
MCGSLDLFSPIRGEIAEIIDEYTVVLNVGLNDLVKPGMRFVVYAETEHIYDKTGKDLGVLEIPKAEVDVKDVQPSLSIAETTATHQVSPMFDLTRAMKVREELQVDKTQIKRLKQNVNMTIVKGDKIREVL